MGRKLSQPITTAYQISIDQEDEKVDLSKLPSSFLVNTQIWNYWEIGNTLREKIIVCIIMERSLGKSLPPGTNKYRLDKQPEHQIAGAVDYQGQKLLQPLFLHRRPGTTDNRIQGYNKLFAYTNPNRLIELYLQAPGNPWAGFSTTPKSVYLIKPLNLTFQRTLALSPQELSIYFVQ